MPKVALVTGAAREIGRAIARHLLDNRWRVGVVALKGAGLARAYTKNARRTFITGADFIVDGGLTRKMIYEP